MSAPGRAVRAPRPPSHHGKGVCSLYGGRVPVVYRSEHILAISRTWRIPKCDAECDARPSTWRESSWRISYGRSGQSRRQLTRSCFSMTAPARQGCTDEARTQACMRKAMNPAASTPSCAGVRRIRCRDRGSLGNPNGQTNDRLRTSVNGGGPDGPGAGGAVECLRPVRCAIPGSSDRSGDGFLSPVTASGSGERRGGVYNSRSMSIDFSSGSSVVSWTGSRSGPRERSSSGSVSRSVS